MLGLRRLALGGRRRRRRDALGVRIRARLLGRRHERHRAGHRGQRGERRLAGVGRRGRRKALPGRRGAELRGRARAGDRGQPRSVMTT